MMMVTRFDLHEEEQGRWMNDPMLFHRPISPFVFPSFTRLSFASQFSHEEERGGEIPQ